MSLNMRTFDDRLSCYELSREVMGNHVPLDNLRLEVAPSRFYLLPYHHLEFSEFESAHNGDTISLSFINHKVRITGRNLRDLAIAFQERAVVSVTPVPENYGALRVSVQGLIDSIQIE